MKENEVERDGLDWERLLMISVRVLPRHKRALNDLVHGWRARSLSAVVRKLIDDAWNELPEEQRSEGKK